MDKEDVVHNTMVYFSTMKRNEIEIFVMKWMDPESVILSEVSQKEKNIYCILRRMYEI